MTTLTSTTESQRLTKRFVLVLAATAGAIAFLYSAYIAIRYSGRPMLIRNFAFRQTQTALTSFWACRDGFKFAYETPVGGAPWAIPFEFPIYQWVVSALSCPLGFDLVRVGRIVSYVFLALCALPAGRICRSLFPVRWTLYWATTCAVFFSAPLHIFFGNAFLMESAALFFSLYFVSYSISLIQGGRSISTALLAGTFLTLAILQKSTTVLPLVPVFGFWLLAVAFPELRNQGVKAKVLWLGIIAVVIPFVIGAVWAKYTDVVKMHNEFGAALTSSALTKWNFGGNRFDWRLWLWVIWLRNVVTNVAGWIGVGVLLAGVVVLDRRHRGLIVLGVALFLSYFMIFTNLQYVHEYYQMSNEAFLLFAVAVGLGGFLASTSRLANIAGAIALIAVVGVNIQTFRTGQNFQWLQEAHGADDPVLVSAHFVRENTDPSRPIIVYGDDWSSEFPFYSERKAFAVPKFFQKYDDVYRNPVRYLGAEPSAVLVCRDERSQEFESRIVAAFKPDSVQKFELCDIFLKK